MLRKLFTPFWLLGLSLLLTKQSYAQSGIVVTLLVDNASPHGYCDVLTYTFTVKNLSSPSTFTGRIEYNSADFEVVDINNLPNASETSGSGNTRFITFDINTIPTNVTYTFTFQMIVKAYTSFDYSIKARATRNPGGPFEEVERGFSGGVTVYRPIYGTALASELIEAFENNGNYGGPLTLLPVNAPPLSPNLYACNENFGQKIYIDETLIIDVPEYCFEFGAQEGALIMGEASTIVVESGSTLKINNVSMGSCQKMWKGIYVKNGGSLLLNNVLITNAQYGIQAERGSIIKSEGSTFYNNFIGLYVSPESNFGDPSFINITSFYNNSFVGIDGKMLPGYDGQTPVPTEKPYAGIHISNLSSFNLPGYIVTGQDRVNFFEDLTNGIIANNANLRIGDIFFRNITSDPNAQWPFEGYGISNIGSQYTSVWGNAVGSLNEFGHHFENCETGIYSSSGYVEIKGMTMAGVNTGIHLRKIGNTNIEIVDNNMYGVSGTGILLNHCAPRSGTISDNIISAGGDGEFTTCIEMNDFPIPTRWNIENNYLIINNGKYAIVNKSGHEINIMNNTIDVNYAGEDDVHGIFLLGTKRPVVSCNLLTGNIEPNESNFHNSAGIFFEGANDFNISCNDISDFRFGIKTSSDNSGVNELRGNTFGNNWVGLYMGVSAIIGAQKHKGNIWDGTFYDFAAVHTGNFDVINNSLFYYDKADNSYFEPPSIDASTAWFFNRMGDSWICEPEEVCPEGIGFSGFAVNWDSLDLELINADIGFDNFDSELSWRGRFHTYRRLHNSGLPIPTALGNYISSQQTLNIGKFSNAFDSLNIAIKYSGDLESALDDFPIEFAQYSKDIHLWDSLMYEGRNRDSLTSLIIYGNETIESIVDEFMEKSGPIGTYLDVKLANAISYTDNIIPSSDLQEALKFTLLEFMNYMDSDTLTHSADIYDLANECPDEFGDAVYHARSLIRADSMINYFDDDNTCAFLSPRSNVEQYAERMPMPNPARDQTKIEYSQKVNYIIVFNTSGTKITMPYHVEQGYIYLNTAHLPDGLYFVSIINEEGEITVSKLVIAH